MWTFSDLIIPLIISGILIYGLYKGIDVFNVFIKGAKQGIGISLRIVAPLVALITSVGMFKASGGLDVICNALEPIGKLLFLPTELIPLAILRPISGSGALVIFENILKDFGPDSFVGRVASVMQGSTETTFYTIAVYYGATKIIKTRYTLAASLTADIVGFIISGISVYFLLGS
ncbi:MAG: spore maturation protein [Oscillospiraceae bacterium]|nr:spore maturation protein [Oscillospiraceae bacterium]